MAKISERAGKHIEYGVKTLELTGLDAEFARAWGERLYWMGSADLSGELLLRLLQLASDPAFEVEP